MKAYNKYGLGVMAIWILFVIIIVSSYAAYNNCSFLEYFIDEETSGIISTIFFVAWALIWFAIGSHGRKEYEAMLMSYSVNYPDIRQEDIRNIVKTHYFAKLAKLLTISFGTAVPGWWIVKCIQHSESQPTTKDYIVSFVLIILTFVSYLYHKKKTQYNVSKFIN